MLYMAINFGDWVLTGQPSRSSCLSEPPGDRNEIGRPESRTESLRHWVVSSVESWASATTRAGD